MTKFAKHIPECSEQASEIQEKEEDHQNDSVEEEKEEYSEEVPETRTVTEDMSTNKRIQRYLIAVEYIGTRFSGSQKQLNCRTVVGVLEEAFHKFIGQPVSISLSSRTDAGVHAASNVCHLDIERISKRKPGEVLPPHDSTVVRRAVNHFLQANSPIRTLDELHVSEVVSTAICPSIMDRGLNSIINPDSPVISIDNIGKLGMPNDGRNVFGLRKKHRSYEVRLIVGVLKAVGTGELTVSDVERILKAKTVTAASPMAPACGLYLGFVKYDLPEDGQTDAVETLETSLDPVSRKRRLQ